MPSRFFRRFSQRIWLEPGRCLDCLRPVAIDDWDQRAARRLGCRSVRSAHLGVGGRQHFDAEPCGQCVCLYSLAARGLVRHHYDPRGQLSGAGGLYTVDLAVVCAATRLSDRHYSSCQLSGAGGGHAAGASAGRSHRVAHCLFGTRRRDVGDDATVGARVSRTHSGERRCRRSATPSGR